MPKPLCVVDTECYPDLFLVTFLDPATGKTAVFSTRAGPLDDAARSGIATIMAQRTTVSFNGLGFDLYLLSLAATGASVKRLKALSDAIIRGEVWRLSPFGSLYNVIPRTWDHIDLIDVAPGVASLKAYGARLGVPDIQDLPFPPDAPVGDDGVAVVTTYCHNDCKITWALYQALRPQIDLRVAMGVTYKMDLRSSGDAAIAEHVILHETGTRRGGEPYPDGHIFRLSDPGIIQFQTPALMALFDELMAAKFEFVGGKVRMPSGLEGRLVTVGHREYRIGVGGLHSTEKSRCLAAAAGYDLVDYDVVSYYPSIIQQQRLAPKNMGARFYDVYQSLLTRRVEAKKRGDKVTADTLKIVTNSSFGKLGNKYSRLCAPELLAQVTVTGQLALLMLIERFELAGVSVASANTDGVVVYASKGLAGACDQVVWDWQLDTGFELEATPYLILAQRDVNNYVAIGAGGKVKRKGLFTEPGLAKNPACSVVSQAVVRYLAEGRSLETHILMEDDIKAFVSARRVTGGATWRGQRLGKVVRWYYSREVPDDEVIAYAKNSNKVPNTGGARPCMQLPSERPKDLNYDRYLAMAKDLLVDIGVFPPPPPKPKAPRRAKAPA